MKYCFALILCYWSFLFSATTPQVVYDSVGYLDLGRILEDKGLTEYVKAGPSREPVYPALIALSGKVAKVLSVPLLKVLIFFQLGILGLSLFLLWKLFPNPIVLYFGISPAVLNSALSVYSEIAVYPLVLLAVWSYLKALKSNKWGVLAGVLSVALVLVKGAYEIAIPIFIIPCFLFYRKLSLVLALAVFLLGVSAYKFYNYNLNGHYVVTDRGDWALYGSTKRRVQPLTPKETLAGMSFVAGRGFCEKLFSKDECVYWSFETSDNFAHEQKGDYLKESAKLALASPWQYSFFTLLEGAKMFFWETTSLGFVTYPEVINKIYAKIGDPLRLLIFVFSFLSFGLALFQKDKRVLILFFLSVTVAYSPFLILTRYALPTVPLFFLLWRR